MADIKQWAALDPSGHVLHTMGAPDELVNEFVQRIVEPSGLTTPYWWTPEVVWVDITAASPQPVTGWFRDGAGAWVDGTPKLSVDRPSIPADGVTAARVTFSQKGPKTPTAVTFDVNGQAVSETLSPEGVAVCDIVSSNPGDQVQVFAGGLFVTIKVEG